MMTLQYPVHKKQTTKRILTLADFPSRKPAYSNKAKVYFQTRHLAPGYVLKCKKIYPTTRGICFVLHGGLGFQERVFDDARRFVYPVGVGTGKAVFMPEPEHTNTELVLVEGSADALAVGQAGYRACSYLGTFLPTERLNTIHGLIKDIRRVYVIPDTDAPGQHGLRQILTAFPGARVLRLPLGFKDISELTIPQRKMFLTNIHST